MTIERKLARHYRLRDTAELLMWFPAVSMGLIIAVGLHVYDRPRLVDARIDDAFDAIIYVWLATPAATVVGWVMAHIRRRAETNWPGGELTRSTGGSGPAFPRRLGQYSIKRVFSHREAGVRLTRYRLIKPFRFTVNSALSAFWLFLTFEFIRLVNLPPVPGSHVTPGGFASGTGVMLLLTIAVLIWVNYRWDYKISLVDNRCCLRTTISSGPIRWRAFKDVVAPGPPDIRPSGAAVVIGAGDRELFLFRFSSSLMGVWEAQKLAEVLLYSMGLGASRQARSPRGEEPRAVAIWSDMTGPE